MKLSEDEKLCVQDFVTEVMRNYPHNIYLTKSGKKKMVDKLLDFIATQKRKEVTKLVNKLLDTNEQDKFKN